MYTVVLLLILLWFQVQCSIFFLTSLSKNNRFILILVAPIVLPFINLRWARGFRSGSKLISYATSFDICSGVLQFILFLHIATNYSPSVWEQYSNGGSEWLLTAFARLLHAISAFLYGNGFFLVEVYHDKGTSVLLGLAILVLYIGSAVIGKRRWSLMMIMSIYHERT